MLTLSADSIARGVYTELERSWPRKKMELEHSTAAGLSVLLRPRGGGSVAARGGCAEAAVPGGQTTTTLTPPPSSSSTLSTAVREMLAASRRDPAGKRPRGPCHPPADAESQRSCATKGAGVAPAKEAVLLTARMRQALAKRVARRMLRRRGASPPAPDHGGTKVVLTCCCERLPPGLCCALHQRGGAPGWPWTRDGGGANAVARGWAFGEYARWRRSVWVPSRFYLERAGVGPGERAAPGPALLVERTARCAGVSVRRFLLVGRDPERSGSGL